MARHTRPPVGLGTLGYRPALDGLRGIAILAVLLVHAFNWPRGGFLGVDLFFVLSGFLITALLVEEWKLRGTISLRAFYRRRALRLIPGLVVLVAVYVLVRVALVTTDPGRSTRGLGPDIAGALAGIFYVSNIVQAAGAVLPAGIRHLWSLGTEEQFYLLWPPVLLLTLRHVRLPVQRLKRVLIAGLFLVVTWRLILTLLGASQHRLYFGPDMSCDCLIVGCIAGLWFATNSIPSVFRNPLSRRALAAAALVAMSATMLFTQGWGDRSLFAGTLTVFAIASGILILCCTLEPAGLLGRSLQVQPLVFTGRISYSLYLWHPLILTQSRLAPIPAVVASFAIATASYYGIERPFLRRKRSERSRLLTSFADRVPETSKSIDLPPGALAAGSART